MEQNTQLQTQVQHLTAANTLSEVTRRLGELNTDEVEIAPAVMTELAAFAARLPTQAHDPFFGSVKKLLSEQGVVRKGEIGYAPGATGNTQSEPEETGLEKAARKLLSEDKSGKLTFADAVEQAAAAEPRLFAEHQQSTYAWKE
jgi:hypothetical protein